MRCSDWARGVVAALAALLAVGAPYAVRAQTADTGRKTLEITVPEEGEYFVRFLPSSDARQPAQLPMRFLDRRTVVEYDLAEIGKKAQVAVDDVKTGNTAIRPLHGPGAPGTGGLDLRKTDFDHIRQVDIRVTYGGKPVKAAQVTLAGRSGAPVTRTVDPAKRGVATFEDVPVGRAKVTVVYGDKLTQSQDVDLVSDHPAGPVKVDVAVANSVPVLDEPGDRASDAGKTAGASTPTADSGAPRETVPASGGVVGWIGNLLGLLIAGGAIYLLYRWAKSGGMAATLQKAGIEVSGPTADTTSATPWSPAAPPPPVVADPSACQFCGQPKDASGQCACSDLPGAAGLSAAGAVGGGAGEPRLIGSVGVYAGAIFAVSSPATIGRDPSNTIALSNDNTVSRRHATITPNGSECIVADEGSSNGVYVNGVRISGTHALKPGDEVQIGATRFRFEA